VRLLLDTSILVCFYKKEFGWQLALDKIATASEVLLSAISIAEFGRLCMSDGKSIEVAYDALESVMKLITAVIPVDKTTSITILEITSRATSRAPLVDSVIAATAIQHGAVLLHRDAHFRSIPQSMLHQEELPAPNSIQAPSSTKAPDSIQAKEGT